MEPREKIIEAIEHEIYIRFNKAPIQFSDIIIPVETYERERKTTPAMCNCNGTIYVLTHAELSEKDIFGEGSEETAIAITQREVSHGGGKTTYSDIYIWFLDTPFADEYIDEILATAINFKYREEKYV